MKPVSCQLFPSLGPALFCRWWLDISLSATFLFVGPKGSFQIPSSAEVALVVAEEVEGLSGGVFPVEGGPVGLLSLDELLVFVRKALVAV